jgi:hypothetical protein
MRFHNSIVSLAIVFLFIWATPASAYTDPGSGLMLWQILGAAAIGSLFYVKRFLAWIGVVRKKDDR